MDHAQLMPKSPSRRADYRRGPYSRRMPGYLAIPARLVCTIKPIQWLKGGEGSEDTNVSSWEGRSEVRGQRFLLFLRTLRDRAHPFYPPDDDWLIIEAPHIYGGGALLLDAQSEVLEEKKVRKAIERLSVDSLASRSDLIVICDADSHGHGTLAPIYGMNRPCRLLGIEQRLLGVEPRDMIPVYSVMGGIKPRRSVLFLKAMPGGVYELVSFHAGQDEIEGSQVRSGETLEELERRVKAVSAARGGERK